MLLKTGMSVCLTARHFQLTSMMRLMTTAAATSSKANLAKLRRKTGFSFVNCRKALEKFSNDVDQAEVWLREQAQKEGWSKATKLQGRVTAQGLIGVMCQTNSAIMVEVNCETDFVARNAKFQNLVSHVASAALFSKKGQHEDQNILKLPLSAEDLKSSVGDDGKTMEDLAALTIGQAGENMSIRRGLYLEAPQEFFIGSYVHSALQKSKEENQSKCTMGKYAALVVFKKLGETTTNFRPEVLGRRLSQHVVGMNPLRIGVYSPPDPEDLKSQEMAQPPQSDQSESDPSDEHASVPSSTETETDEMVNQEYLLDPSLTVGELLLQENVEVVDFARFECGESTGDS
ncbi:elongation factor Ts, mitochondrial [Strongylocentrotus purpuratus]|uniref:Elongation factor Ts, mitochondrial n=1 Tax=Strongylocentrotus purpuratus TaxID=7668 RepID=A0A7M7N1Q2_STRPU|nr:elongation factor Ts, mitochondrial [Strongylocentrotus purpuratus]